MPSVLLTVLSWAGRPERACGGHGALQCARVRAHVWVPSPRDAARPVSFSLLFTVGVGVTVTATATGRDTQL